MAPLIVRVSFIPLFTILYLSLVYRRWSNLQELSPIMLYCLLLGIFVGVFLSMYKSKHPNLEAFALTAPAPILAYFIEISTVTLISAANAQLPLRELIPQVIESPSGEQSNILISPILVEISIQLSFAALFGLFAILGRHFGATIQPITEVLLLDMLTQRKVACDIAEIRAAYISARATVVVAVIGAASTLTAVALS